MLKLLLPIFLFLSCSSAFGQDTLNVMFYNILRYPVEGAASRIFDYRTIFQYEQPDVLLICELQTEAAGQQILDVALNAYGKNNYKRADFMLNYTGDNLFNMCYYNSDKLTLHKQDSIRSQPRDIGVYTMWVNSPQAGITEDSLFIDFFSTHFKSGNTQDNMDDRWITADEYVKYITYRVPGNRNRIFAGDFNMYSSGEMAYIHLTQDGPQKLEDPINKPGTWHNNSSFAAIHTQSPRSNSFGGGVGGGMDDRYDLILASENIMAGTTGVTYLPNSYEAIGNDGFHYNQSINSGTNNSAPDSVIQALYNASDHLPLKLEIEVAPLPLTPVSNSEIFHENGLKIFPNPTRGNSSITLAMQGQKIKEVRLLDLVGRRKQLPKLAPGKVVELDLREVPSGIYLLQIQLDQAQVVRRLVVENE